MSMIKLKEKLLLISLLLSVGFFYGCEQENDEILVEDTFEDEALEPETAEPEPMEPVVPARETAGATQDPETVSGFLDHEEPLVQRATAQLAPKSGSDVTGSVTFEAVPDSEEVRVNVLARGLTAGEHGFHIHVNGDCSAPDASSAGGHYNPEDVSHGAPEDDVHHVGDMGNVTADEDGNVDAEMTFDYLAFAGEASVLGRAVIIHEQADDLESQPSGAAGDRIACGVIRPDN